MVDTLLSLVAQSTTRTATNTPAGTSSLPFRTLALASPLERLGVAPDLARLVERLASIAAVVALMFVALRLVPWAERLILDKARKSGSHTATQSEIDLNQRVETLTRVVTSLFRAAILSVAVVMVLGELGMEIKPLLAGAGIAGVAVGFGAQTIVKDFFSGFFILLEDQFDVGDTVTIGAVTGKVERMTLRVTMVRDASGTAHFIPNSAIAQVANRTHGWSRASVDLTFRAKVRVGLAKDLLEDAAKHAKTVAPLADDAEAEISIEGPNELEWGGTKWTVAVRAPATLVATYKRALVEAIHFVLESKGYEPDDGGRLGSS
ncbi:MAG: mechanosensitive ion channel family protein [Myxococcales bacterium]|nr:mechanosensitive ion channel family protein [Myxococcales bacterium]